MAALDPCPTQGATVKYFAAPDSSGYTWTDLGGAIAQIYQGFSLQKRSVMEQLSGTTGNRQRHEHTYNEVLRTVGGTLSKRMSAIDADFYLPKLMNVSQFAVLQVIDTVERYEYRDLKIASATLSGTEGQSVDLSMDVVGLGYRDKDGDQDDNASNTAAADPDASIAQLGLTGEYKPLLFGELVLTIGGDTHSFGSAALTISNGPSVRFYNSKNAKCIEPGMRDVLLQLSEPYNADTIAAWKNLGNTGVAGATLSLFRYFDPPTNSQEVGFTVTLGKLKYPDDGPEVAGDDDIGWTINAQAFYDGTTDDVAISAVDIVPGS